MKNLFIIVYFTFLINSKNCETFNNEISKSNSMDDSIGRTDYLITLYSTQIMKPCVYFCNY